MKYLFFGTLCLLLLYFIFVDVIPPSNATMMRMRQIESRTRLYWDANKELPPTLAILPELKGKGNSTFDGWGREIGYKAEGTKVTLSSLGADGKPGGLDVNEDIVYIFDVSKERQR